MGNTVSVVGLVVGAGIIHLVLRPWLLRVIQREIHDSPIRWDDALLERRVPARLALLMPQVVLLVGVGVIPGLSNDFVSGSQRVLKATVVLTVMMTVFALTRAAEAIYTQHYEQARTRPIKGYLQLCNLVVFAVAAVLIVAALSATSPVVVLSGIGALMAILLLVFADSITGLVASVQIHTNDLLQVGDWIEAGGVEGEVVDMTLHSVRIRNSDMTETTLPVRDLTTGSFTNWRSMYAVGGRRIKRAIHLDLTTVRFLTDDELDVLMRKELLNAPLAARRAEQVIDESRSVEPGVLPHRRRITNVSAFRVYTKAYLDRHPDLHHDGMTTLVRPLAPGPDGLPIEIYAFARQTGFEAFEVVQADIFDHLLSAIPEFGLRVFQNPTGQDLSRLAAPAIEAAPPLDLTSIESAYRPDGQRAAPAGLPTSDPT